MVKLRTNVLIAYSSGYGVTKEISEEIAHILSQDPHINIELKPIDNIDHINGYSSVIVGTSVRADKLLANTRDFFATFRKELPNKKVAVFVVCLTASTPEGRKKVLQDYVPQIFERYNNLKPVSVAAFGGKIDFDRLNPVMQKLVKHVYEKTGVNGEGSVDNRDWDQIRAWVKEVKSKIL